MAAILWPKSELAIESLSEIVLNTGTPGSRASASRRNNNQSTEPQEESSGGFGLTLNNLTAQMARRLQLPSGQTGAIVTDVDPNSSAATQLRQGDVIMSVNGVTVSNAADAKRELDKVESGRIARILLWRGDGEVFVAVKKD